MKIKKLLSTSLIFFLPFLLILLILFNINILIKDFNFAHKAFNVDAKSMNWVKYSFALKKKKITNFFLQLTNRNEGLPKVKIYIPEKTSNKLLSDIPISTKTYLRAEKIIDGKKRNVRVRYFGDNPINWMFDQKAIRIKTRKSEINERRRYYEYKPSQRRILDEYIGYKFAKKLGLLVSEARLVELFVNDDSTGIYIEKERLNESFLRRNKIMPVNLYKGEASRNSEKKIGLQVNLDNNPGLWSKISFLNSVEEDNYEDLIKFSNQIRKAENSEKQLGQLLKFGNADLFAKTEILGILLNLEINSLTHNRRLLIDVWSGKKHIIPHDFYYNRNEINLENNKFDSVSSTRLHNVLNQSSEYLDVKYNLLHKIVIEEKIFEKIILDLQNIQQKYLISQKTDLGQIHRKYVLARNNIGPENKDSFNALIKSLKKREQKIINFLKADSNSSWEISNKGFHVKINDFMPISNLLIKFKDLNPKWIIFDRNNNEHNDKGDLYFFPDLDGNFLINLKLFSNRIPVNKNPLTSSNFLVTGNTKFNFFIENNLKPSELITFNNYTKKIIPIKADKSKALKPSLHNKVILKNQVKKVNILKGNIFLKNDLIIKDETKIIEGTSFTLSEGVSIIFENKVEAIGTDKKPIIFNKHPSLKNWGTVAIHGVKTQGSVFKNIIIQNGSGDSIDGVNYFSALSVHSAKDIIFDNLLVKNNARFDDLMHIIYSENIKISNSKFLNAYRDAIDVDISKNILFKNTKIIGAGNDGVDFMESSARLNQMVISSSGDKGISVGENSKVFITNSIFKSNNFAIASKDLSKVKIENSLLEDNKIQLSVYQKNWRYGGSGKIEVKDSKLVASENNIASDEKGIISISSSNIKGKISKTQNVIIN